MKPVSSLTDGRLLLHVGVSLYTDLLPWNGAIALYSGLILQL